MLHTSNTRGWLSTDKRGGTGEGGNSSAGGSSTGERGISSTRGRPVRLVFTITEAPVILTADWHAHELDFAWSNALWHCSHTPPMKVACVIYQHDKVVPFPQKVYSFAFNWLARYLRGTLQFHHPKHPRKVESIEISLGCTLPAFVSPNVALCPWALLANQIPRFASAFPLKRGCQERCSADQGDEQLLSWRKTTRW